MGMRVLRNDYVTAHIGLILVQCRPDVSNIGMASALNMISQITTLLIKNVKSIQVNGFEVTVSQISNRYPGFVEKIT